MTDRYRKKPVEVRAWKIGFDGKEPDWVSEAFDDGRIDWCPDGEGLYISTLEGDMKASIGDMLIEGVKGELYGCRADIFAATYEPVETTSPPHPEQADAAIDRARLVERQGACGHLRDFATGKLRHVYRGGCPDQVNGPDARDPACPACQAIEAARFGSDADTFREPLAERDQLAAALEAAQMGLRYAARVWVLSDEIAWSEAEIDEAVESIISDAKKEAGRG